MNPLQRLVVPTLLLTMGGCAAPAGPEPADASDETQSPACHAAPLQLEHLRLSADGTRLIDAAGRHVLLRGVNTGGRSKFAPFFPFPFAESGLENQGAAPPFAEAVQTYFDRVSTWGHNIVRMPFSWEALEPERGSFDSVYLGRYLQMVQAAGERDIRVIVDFHQDVFAAPYCGDGFPLWACPEPVPQAPEDCSSWFMAYLQTQSPIHAAYGRFWTNDDGLMDDFEAMWVHMATAAWQHPNVIGFEIINEPHHGNQDEDTWAKTDLPAFYERLRDRIHDVAPEALIFFDSTGIDAATQEPTLEKPKGEGFVFAPHFYLMSIYTGGELDLGQVPEDLSRWGAKSEEWNVPVLVGEYGIYRDVPEAPAYFSVIMDSLDELLLSGTAWEVSTTVDDWNDEGMSLIGPDGKESKGLESLIRPFPRAVAGVITSFSYDPATRVAQLKAETVSGGLSEIALPARLFPDGVQIDLGGTDGCFEIDEAAEILRVRTNAAGPFTLTISGK